MVEISSHRLGWGRNKPHAKRKQRFQSAECEDFKNYRRTFHKDYEISEDCNGEDDMRAEFFKENKITVENHNQRFTRGEETFYMSISDNADLSFEEAIELRMGLKLPPSARSLPVEPAVPYVPNNVPASVDWRDGTGFQPIKDQGDCGSCWAFAVVSCLEFLVLRQGVSISLSEQNLVDCSTADHGCSGGWPTNSFKYVKQNGIATSSYVYAEAERTCRKESFPPKVRIGNYCEERLGGNEARLMELTAKYGPIVVAVEATKNFILYGGGVFSDSTCGTGIDHAVVVVGYGTDDKYGNYWLIRNSWGE
ncbi:CLUMA_CG015117, isoform A [Clunio marinus]|uniref:CLUMA_CG015117, isoform A n=1 Tax=Clunio marinus TaxID=568069 RepID=A0A1J1IS53_9DIPT|nr:CLUMA_CG015117, isoform A [Clunio marinus]